METTTAREVHPAAIKAGDKFTIPSCYWAPAAVYTATADAVKDRHSVSFGSKVLVTGAGEVEEFWKLIDHRETVTLVD